MRESLLDLERKGTSYNMIQRSRLECLPCVTDPARIGARMFVNESITMIPTLPEAIDSCSSKVMSLPRSSPMN